MNTPHIEADAGVDPAHAGTGKVPNSFIFAPLFVPFGISSGYVSVTLAFLLREAGLPVATIAVIASLSVWPQTVKMIWAPIVDTIGNPKLWYGIGTITVGLSILLMSVLPMTQAEVPVFIALIVGSSVTSTFVSMSTEIFLANTVPPNLRGRASGWSQAGNLGGAGLGGGVGLLLAKNVGEPWVSGAVLAVSCFVCWAAMLFMPRIVRTAAAAGRAGGFAEAVTRYLHELREVVVNVWAVARSRIGYLALIIMLLPIGSGGVPWSAISQEWGAGANMVAAVNGLAGGGASVVGAMAAGYVCDRMDPKRAYSAFGILVGLVAVALIFAPRTPTMFAVGVLAYQAMVGTAYTGYAVIVLEAIGKKSAATNWNLMAALSNAPVAAMGMFDGWMHDRFGTNWMLFGELFMPGIALVLFGLFVLATRPRRKLA